jgi:hypothetical protein
MRERALIHAAGPVGAGKTTFIERLLDAEVAFAICVRAERDPKLRKEQESAPKAHAELRRYREAGASAVALYRFAEPSMDAFFTSAFMQDYSEAVFMPHRLRRPLRVRRARTLQRALAAPAGRS